LFLQALERCLQSARQRCGGNCRNSQASLRNAQCKGRNSTRNLAYGSYALHTPHVRVSVKICHAVPLESSRSPNLLTRLPAQSVSRCCPTSAGTLTNLCVQVWAAVVPNHELERACRAGGVVRSQNLIRLRTPSDKAPSGVVWDSWQAGSFNGSAPYGRGFASAVTLCWN
jgi:hypothetical protein